MKLKTGGSQFDMHVDIYVTDDEAEEILASRGMAESAASAFSLEPSMKSFREICEGIVDAAPHRVEERGTKEAFAAEALHYMREAQLEVDRSDAEAAAACAFAAGWRFEQMRLKFTFEAMAATGMKTHNYLRDIREGNNAKAKKKAADRRRVVANLIKQTSLTGGALDSWLKRNLEERFDIKVSLRTIRGDRRALK